MEPWLFFRAMMEVRNPLPGVAIKWRTNGTNAPLYNHVFIAASNLTTVNPDFNFGASIGLYLAEICRFNHTQQIPLGYNRSRRECSGWVATCRLVGASGTGSCTLPGRSLFSSLRILFHRSGAGHHQFAERLRTLHVCIDYLLLTGTIGETT